jgi:hypothetical protein
MDPLLVVCTAIEEELIARGLGFSWDPGIAAASAEGLTCIGEGRHRIVYRLNDQSVIKIPRGEWGLASNSREASISQTTDEKGWLFGIRYAKCHEKGPILVMEYVTPVPYTKAMPAWVNFVDCQQVGYDREGNLKAFDFGY